MLALLSTRHAHNVHVQSKSYLVHGACSAEVAELPGMEQLMSTRPALAHKLMITMTAAARASKKRKAETAKPS